MRKASSICLFFLLKSSLNPILWKRNRDSIALRCLRRIDLIAFLINKAAILWVPLEVLLVAYGNWLIFDLVCELSRFPPFLVQWSAGSTGERFKVRPWWGPVWTAWSSITLLWVVIKGGKQSTALLLPYNNTINNAQKEYPPTQIIPLYSLKGAVIQRPLREAQQGQRVPKQRN